MIAPPSLPALVALVLLGGCAVPGASPAGRALAANPTDGPMRPRLELGGGHRVLRERSHWGGAHGLEAVGLQLVWPLAPGAPLAIEGGGTYASGSTPDSPAVDLDVSELFLGLRFAVPPGEGVTTPRLEPYVAGGVAALRAKLDASGESATESAVGAYVRLGVTWHLARRLAVSFDYRVHHQTDIDIAAGPLDVSASSLDAGQFSVQFGFVF